MLPPRYGLREQDVKTFELLQGGWQQAGSVDPGEPGFPHLTSARAKSSSTRAAMAHSNRDPREVGPKPPFPKQKQVFPGSEKLLDPPADHGETSYTGQARLQDRVAIVTGADSGIGRAVAIAFAKEGAHIVMSYLPEEEEDAAEVAAVIESGQSCRTTAWRHPGARICKTVGGYSDGGVQEARSGR